MTDSLHHLLLGSPGLDGPGRGSPGPAGDRTALWHGDRVISYRALADQVQRLGAALRARNIAPGDRVAIYLPKVPEAVIAMFGAASAGAVFVPVNPLLKPRQVAYILEDCDASALVTTRQRAAQLDPVLARCPALDLILVIDAKPGDPGHHVAWQALLDSHEPAAPAEAAGDDTAAILYTSGSTGQPKGVVLSHTNMVTGARSVASYLENDPADRLLAVLPFSFDYGLSQLTTAFLVGAGVVLMEYLLPRDVIKAVARYRVTGLAAVPPLWNQLAALAWPAEAVESLRYLTNSGGAMPVATTKKLREALPATAIYLMYGLTEAFRSTYLPPELVDERPESIGKAIPHAEIHVVRPDGSECDCDEPGELVHAGPLVARGYWNAPEKTARRFRPWPPGGDAVAVWSGDRVRRDRDGFLYFVSREDEMIKTSGYRVSPTEVEDVFYSAAGVEEAVVLGAPHPALGEGIIALVVLGEAGNLASLEKLLRTELPNYMQPQALLEQRELPRNPNGKIDRARLKSEYLDWFKQESS